MIIHSIVPFGILSMRRNIDFFCEKSRLMLSLNASPKGIVINPPVSLAQKTFHPARPAGLPPVLGPDATAYSTMIKDLRQRQFPSILLTGPRSQHARDRSSNS
jgi:hypothetical protein